MAEQVSGLPLVLTRYMVCEQNYIKAANRKRIADVVIWRDTIAIIGLGRIGKEIAKRAKCFEMEVISYDLPQFWPDMPVQK